MSISITSYNLELANEAYKSERIASLEKQLSDAKAALRASTDWLRQCHNIIEERGWPETCNEIRNQIAANERLLGGGQWEN